MVTLRRFLSYESRATTLAYGLVAAGISLAMLAALIGLSSRLDAAISAVVALLG